MQAKRHARLVLLSVIVAELVTVLLRAGRKPLWFDELVTILTPWGAAVRDAAGYLPSGPHDLASATGR